MCNKIAHECGNAHTYFLYKEYNTNNMAAFLFLK